MGWLSRWFGAEDVVARSDVVRARMRIEQEVMTVHGVVSVGVGHDAEGAEAVVVGVAGATAESFAVPREVDGVPVIVQEVEEMRAQPVRGGEQEPT